MAETSGSFQSLGKGIAILAAPIAPVAQQARVDEGYPSGSFLIHNKGQEDAVIGFGSTPEEAAARAIAPTPLEPSYGIVVPGGAFFTQTFPPNSYFTATIETGSQTIYMYPGLGL